MKIDVEPFDAVAHLDSAAGLLADRHARDRTRDPRLPGAFEMAAACRPIVEQTFNATGWRGVVASVDGKPAGFMLMVPQLFAPTHFLAQFFPPRSVACNYQQHAVRDGLEYDVYREMYAVLADQFVRAGYFEHLVSIAPGDAATWDALASLSFARNNCAALRDVAPPARSSANVEMHLAASEDADVVFGLNEELTLHHAKSPIFSPFLRETEPASHDMQRGLLAHPQANAHWVAYRDGVPLGMNTFMPPSFLSPMIVPQKTIYLLQGIVSERAREGGVGTAILARGAEWAREQGYTHIALHFASQNILGARFWQSSGFVPVEWGLRRTVDSRIAWANR